MKWVVDPGLEGDFYADKPFLYGGLGGSVNSLYIGNLKDEESKSGGEADVGEEGAGKIIHEGGTEQGMGIRSEKGIPDSDAGRKKFFLNDSNKKGWTWEGGREYGCDFFNPYLDFNGTLFCGVESVRRWKKANKIRLRTQITRLHTPHNEILGRSRFTVRSSFFLHILPILPRPWLPTISPHP